MGGEILVPLLIGAAVGGGAAAASGAFSSPDVPEPTPLPPVEETPSMEQAEEVTQAEEVKKRKRRISKASTILTSPQGVLGEAPVVSKSLLGE